MAKASKYGCVRQTSYCGGGSGGAKEQRKSSRSSRRRLGRKRRNRSKKRCARPGPSTVNPFFNFLRVYRKQHCNWPITKIAAEGAKQWCRMDREHKRKFYSEACRMRKSRGRAGGRGRKGGRGRSSRRGRSSNRSRSRRHRSRRSRHSTRRSGCR